MAKRTWSWWALTLRCAAIVAPAGPCVAIVLYFYASRNTFPEWGVFLWPSAAFLLALPGLSEMSARLLIVAVIASNAIWFFLVAVILTPSIILAKRALAQRRRRASESRDEQEK